ncbi:hypothetical protein NFI96_024143 [Prochilodus magdalenae]|nr:hypothetical protein NFI96_024143 [Prochilodus magdalenae]
MASCSKRKRNTRDMRCVLFPEDVQETFTRRSCEPSKATESWERCSESFWDTGVIKKAQTARRMCSTLQRFRQSSNLARHGTGEEDPVHIAWSSSEEEQSDNECKHFLSLPAPKDSEQYKPCPQTTVGSSSGHYNLLSADKDDLPSIDSDSEDENSNLKEKPCVVVGEISDYSSSDSEAAPVENSRLNCFALEPAEQRLKSVSEWIRSAQALLQTPQKQTNRTLKTPEDSGKKRCRFESGGLAERLNRLQFRQRSAISFWRHQSVSNITTAKEERPGVLVLYVENLWDVSGMQAALCKRLNERKEPCVALFNKDTTTHLAPAVGDTICVYPPWQSLIVEGEQHPIILNTHFSQKVLSEVNQDSNSTFPRVPSSEEMIRPYPLIRCLWQNEKYLKCPQKSSPSQQVCTLAKRDRGGAFESLLEAVESSGPSGVLCGPVMVVVQRVYFFPVKHSSTTYSPKTKAFSKTLPGPTQQRTIGSLQEWDYLCNLCRVQVQHARIWFCILVQDVYGVFSEVELQYVSSEVELKHHIEQLEGKVCVLHGLKVTQRFTRERCTQLFSLIDSLWPPLGSLRVYGEQSCHQTDKVSSPSICYSLAGQLSSVLCLHVSPLYQPPVICTLQEVLQNEPASSQCSFKAAVVYKRIQSAGEDLLLFVTDHSLQSVGSSRRTLTVYVGPSCLLQTSVREAITSPDLKPTLVFRNVVVKNGQILCGEQSVIQLETEHILNLNLSLPQPIMLDELSLESAPCSVCTLTGVVIDVDEESAFSWPTCRQCGSDCLEATQNKQEAFLCVTCGAVDKPVTKMQLEVFVDCSLLSGCTVKIKLQQKSIMLLLNSVGCSKEYEVEHVLGKNVGPLSAFIHVISKRSTLWMSLEEILL